MSCGFPKPKKWLTVMSAIPIIGHLCFILFPKTTFMNLLSHRLEVEKMSIEEVYPTLTDEQKQTLKLFGYMHTD